MFFAHFFSYFIKSFCVTNISATWITCKGCKAYKSTSKVAANFTYTRLFECHLDNQSHGKRLWRRKSRRHAWACATPNRVGLMRPAHGGELRWQSTGPRRWEGRQQTTCPRDKFAGWSHFCSDPRDNLFAEYGSIDYRQHDASLRLSRLNNEILCAADYYSREHFIIGNARAGGHAWLVEADWSLKGEQLRSRLKEDVNRERRRQFLSGPADGRGHLPLEE